jgi:hypothetical protein
MQREAAIAWRWHRDLLAGGRLAEVDRLCQPSLVVHGPGIPPDAPSGPILAARFAAAVRAAFTIEALVADEIITARDRVVVRWTLRGLRVGPFLGLAPTGRRIELSGIDIFRVVDGRIAELWQAYDRSIIAGPSDALRPVDWNLSSVRAGDSEWQ